MGDSMVLILAAGRSSRLGQAKQLLPFKGDILLNHVITEVQASSLDHSLIVLGYQYERIADQLLPIPFVVNEKWAEGMGQSIACGMEIVETQNIDKLLICLCDQPYLSSQIIDGILTKSHNSNKGIIVSDYGCTQGPPVLFAKPYFARLRELSGDLGAKKLIKENVADVDYFPFPRGQYDIDRPEDIKLLDEL